MPPPSVPGEGLPRLVPIEGKQNGSFTVSTNRAGSQKLVGTQGLGPTGVGQAMTGELVRSGGSIKSLGHAVTPPILIGKIHSQHKSVTGFKKTP